MYQNISEKSTKYLTIAIVVVIFLIGLGIGLLINNSEKSQIIIDKNAKIGLPAQPNLPMSAAQQASGNFSASINGTAYYPRDCSAGNRIKEENRIWFETKEEAESQGYKPAQNCN